MVDKYIKQDISKFEYNSKYTAPIKEEYKKWLKKNHPSEYYDNFGGKKPFSKLSKFAKISKVGGYVGLASMMYEFAKEVLDVTGDIPDDMMEREQIRRQMIMDNVPKIVIDEKGNQILKHPDPKSLKDHLPYKKYISKTPNAPGSGDEAVGVDFVWVDPYQEMFPIDTEGYELSKFGWTKKTDKSFLKNQVDITVRDAKALYGFIPPEIKEVGKNVVSLVTGKPEMMEKK